MVRRISKAIDFDLNFDKGTSATKEKIWQPTLIMKI